MGAFGVFFSGAVQVLLMMSLTSLLLAPEWMRTSRSLGDNSEYGKGFCNLQS